jgi:hypothetical protein
MEGCYGGSRALEEGSGILRVAFITILMRFHLNHAQSPGACQAALKFRFSVLQGLQ